MATVLDGVPEDGAVPHHHAAPFAMSSMRLSAAASGFRRISSQGLETWPVWVAAIQSPIVRRTGGFLRQGMTTIYVDSRKRVAGSDSDFEVDLGESLHLQSDARLAVYKIRIADSFLSTDRGRCLY